MLAIYTLLVLIIMSMPLTLAILLRRRFRTVWLWFTIGMATFTISQAIHLPLNHWLTNIGWLKQPGISDEQPLWLTALILGLTAGLCEELARAVGYSLFKKARRLPDGVMFGLGHGGIESIVSGGVLLAATVSALLPVLRQDSPLTLNLDPKQFQAASLGIEQLLQTPWQGLATLTERILALGLHITWSAMVLRAFQRGNAGWIFVAILHHTLVDAAAVILAVKATNAIWIESGIFFVALPGYLWLGWVFRHDLPPQELQPNPLAREIHLFITALRKEMLQLLRTRRVLITAVVFGLFGMASPLLAYFTPEMLRLIPGGETFADLIPTPTTGDAMVQYHKNLTQFAILLVVLFGMGSVAGEKERGLATMILSKPLPRWAFLSAKFCAQSLLFGFGFLLSALGGYIYTVILFGSLEAGAFLAMNLVLIAWVLPFIALTLVGSVLGSTTTAAGGIALLMTLGLSLAGSIPQIGTHLPTALSGWAARLGIQAAGVPAATPGTMSSIGAAVYANYGALAAALGTILICLPVAYGFFEGQEV